MSCVLCPTAQPAAPDLLTCWRCRDRIRDMIDPDYLGDLEHGLPRSIPRLYALLSPVKDAAGDGGRRAPGFAATVPVNTHHSALLDPRSKANGLGWFDAAGRTHWEPERGLLHAGTVLGGWLGMVIEGRPIRRPPPPWTVDRLAAVLLVHLDWCCGQEWVADMAAELREVQSQLRTAVQSRTGEHRPMPIGRCPAVLDVHLGGARCGAPLFVPRNGDAVSCRSCGSVWPRAEWASWRDAHAA